MITYSTSNDRISKVIRQWCRENSYTYSFESDSKEDACCVYPFMIDAPQDAEKDLIERIEKSNKREAI